MTERTELEKANIVKIVSDECEKDETLLEKFIDSGLSEEEFFDKFMATPELKEGELSQDEKNQAAADANLQEHLDEKEQPGISEEAHASTSEQEALDPSGKYVALKSIYVNRQGVAAVYREMVSHGTVLSSAELEPGHLSDGLVKKLEESEE